jgi:hypothetical protein
MGARAGGKRNPGNSWRTIKIENNGRESVNINTKKWNYLKNIIICFEESG